MIAKDYELANYLLKAQGISRIGLNIMCFIGIFIFGWLLLVVFNRLGKKNHGWFYIVPTFLLLFLSRKGATELGYIAPIIYIAGWAHANILLSRYHYLAKLRITEIGNELKNTKTTNLYLEIGLLKAKVLGKMQKAKSDFTKVLELSGGDSQLLNLAGEQLIKANLFREAVKIFDRAFESTQDKELLEKIKKNWVSAKHEARLGMLRDPDMAKNL